MILIVLTGLPPYLIMPIASYLFRKPDYYENRMVFSDFGYYLLLCLIWAGIFAIFWAICGYIIFRFFDRKLRACPDCKRKAVGFITDTEIERLGTEVDHSGKEPVRVKSEKVIDHYECKHCGHIWMRTYERKERLPLEKRA